MATETVATAFSEDYDRFVRAGVTVLPISVDSVRTLKEYKAKYAMKQDLAVRVRLQMPVEFKLPTRD